MTKLAAASRRSLLLGAGASVASAFMPHTGHATMPELTTVAQNAINPHGSQRFMAACMQQNMVDAVVIDHVNDTLNSRMLCLAPSGCSISDIVPGLSRLEYDGWQRDELAHKLHRHCRHRIPRGPVHAGVSQPQPFVDCSPWTIAGRV